MKLSFIKRSYWGREAAGIILIAADTKRLLLALRSPQVVEPGTWGTIGGRKNPSDKDFKDAALRELQEETGIDPETVAYVMPLMDFKDPDKFIYRTFVGVIPAEIDGKLNKESSDLHWFTLEEARALEDKHPGLIILMDVAGDLLDEIVACEYKFDVPIEDTQIPTEEEELPEFLDHMGKYLNTRPIFFPTRTATTPVPRKGEQDMRVVTVSCTVSGAKALLKLLEHIQGVGNMGHTFSIITDPGDREEKVFEWDGDGTDYIDEITISGGIEDPKEEE